MQLFSENKKQSLPAKKKYKAHFFSQECTLSRLDSVRAVLYTKPLEPVKQYDWSYSVMLAPPKGAASWGRRFWTLAHLYKHLPFPKAKTSKATFCQWRPTRQSFGNILSVPPGYKYVGHVPSSVMDRLSSRKTSLSFQKPNLLDSTLEEFTTCLAHRSSKRLNVKEKKKLFFFLFILINEIL